jgi:hypothetical protein
VNKLALVTASLLALLGAAGCNSDYSMEARDLTTPPLSASITGERMDLPMGIAVGFVAVPKRGGDELDEDNEIAFASSDPGVARIAPTTAPRGFVIWGVQKGTTTIVMSVDGADQLTIPVEVRAQ